MTTSKTNTKPPKSLGKAGKKFWESVLAEYALSDEHHFRILENASLCLDRAAAARAKIDADGITTTNSRGELKEHPACGTERQSLNAFRQNVRELGLDLDNGPVEPARGPRRPGSRQ